ncbi:MAG: hypothetical protein CO114_03630 [Euryarchaeota archaeon CG_4_9_14_3_um_filter_38_12]|nr:MAG: hypothetical protein CO114_03630 [Euryarchaeota archaeon CG_4_9_14_3_um_filter_38_12]
MKITKLSHAYKFPGFRPLAYVKEMPFEPGAVIVPLKRTYQKKSQNARIAIPVKPVGTTTSPNWSGTSPADSYAYILNLIYGVSTVGSATW